MSRTEIRYERLNHQNFDCRSLDGFIRRQTVRESRRKIDGTWRLIPNDYEENWDLIRRREIAADIARHMETDQSAFGAFSGEQLVGFITVSHALFGQSARYAPLVCFQVSEPYRRQGVGKRLFALAAGELTALGADRLYISAHSSQESQAAYRALGCVDAAETNASLNAEEPFDVPLEYQSPAPESKG